jgi:hypothetical protein
MFRAFLQMALGRIGRGLLALYARYSLPLNLVAVAYGVVTIVAHQNLRAVVRQMEALMVEIAETLGDRPDPRKVLRAFAERWREEQGERRLFLPTQTDLWFRHLGTADLIELLHIGREYVGMALHKHMAWPDRKSFHPVDFGIWEEYRHRLLIGIRSKLPDIKMAKARYEQKQLEKRKRRGSSKRGEK